MFSSNDKEDQRRLSGATKQKIMEILLEGPRSLGEITDKLQIQKSAVRVHLQSLQSEKAVESHFEDRTLRKTTKDIQLNRKWARTVS